jgi:hypothetical protein
VSTPAPKVRTLQEISPVAVSFKSFPNSSIRSTIAVPRPPITHVTRAVNTRIVLNARDFFHAGQFNGSFTSSEGCGIKTMSVLPLSLN